MTSKKTGAKPKPVPAEQYNHFDVTLRIGPIFDRTDRAKQRLMDFLDREMPLHLGEISKVRTVKKVNVPYDQDKD